LNLKLVRFELGKDYTIGSLHIVDDVDETPFCFTLEDRDRHLETGGKKVDKETAIPLGVYTVRMGESPHFGHVPFVLDVPQFTDIRIHAGNTAENTEGCILVGDSWIPGFVTNSRATLAKLINRIELAGGECLLEVTRAQESS